MRLAGKPELRSTAFRPAPGLLLCLVPVTGLSVDCSPVIGVVRAALRDGDYVVGLGRAFPTTDVTDPTIPAENEPNLPGLELRLQPGLLTSPIGRPTFTQPDPQEGKRRPRLSEDP